MRLGGSVSTRIRARGISIHHVFPLFFPIFHTLGGCRTACSHADRDRDGNGGCVARDVPRRCALLVLATYSTTTTATTITTTTPRRVAILVVYRDAPPMRHSEAWQEMGKRALFRQRSPDGFSRYTYHPTTVGLYRFRRGNARDVDFENLVGRSRVRSGR